MTLQISPSELDFTRPFTKDVARTLRLTNTGDVPIAFKIKTTAPKSYCVRPNSSQLKSGETVEVQVLLQAMKEEPPLDQKCRDKFLIQSVPISTDQQYASLSQIWKDSDEHNKGAIKEHKLRVTFLPPGETQEQHAAAKAQKHNSETGAHLNPEDPVTFGTPSGSRATERPTSAMSSNAQRHASEPFVNAEKPADHSRQRSGSVRVSKEEEPTTTTPTTLEKEFEHTKLQLQEAQAQIGKLREQLADQGLRQRKATTDSNHDTNGFSEKQQDVQEQQQLVQQEQGVSLQIVAMLCLTSFIIAYLFF